MPKKKKRVIATHKEAAEAARDLFTLREALKVTKKAEVELSEALHDFLLGHRETKVEQEGFETLRRVEQSGGLEWDFANMPDEDLHVLRDMGVLSVMKGKYDEYVEAHGPVGLLNKWAFSTGVRVQLRFEKPSLRHPRERITRKRGTDGSRDPEEDI